MDEVMANESITNDDLSGTNNVAKLPELFTGDSLLELCNAFWMSSADAKTDVQPYLRGCKWSPDGTCCLSVVNRDGFHIMELPHDLYDGFPSLDRMITVLPAVIHVKESGLVYDFCWYPKMNSHYPETCSWISTKINSPIQMWDAYNGSLRCSYRGYNAVDEMEPALSVTFISNGARIVGGYKNCLRTFEVERPGRDYIQHKTKSPASCFATHGNLLAVGSWNTSIKLYNISESGTYKSIGNLHAHTGGITHLQFTPDGSKLVSGARKDHSLCVWDIRYYRRPLNILRRSASTNQRIYFDISTCGRYLVSGGTDGVVRVWDNNFTKWTEQYNVNRDNEENATFRFRLHRDCCNSISIHPSRPILATGSGQFHILDPARVLKSECDSSTYGVEDATIETQYPSNGSSSDEEILVENIKMPFTGVKRTDFPSEIEIHTKVVSERSSTEVLLNTTKELSDKISKQNVSQVLPMESSNEPMITPKCDNDFNETVVKGTCIPIVETDLSFDEAYIDEKPPNKKSKLDATNESCTEVTNLGYDSSTGESHIKNNIDIQSIKYSETDKAGMIFSKEPNFISTNEHNRDSEPAGQNESKTFNELPSQVIKVDIDSQITSKLAKLIESDRLLNNVSNIHHLNKSDSEHTLDKDWDSDDDSSENKMKFSSYAENNLTFWWIDKIFDRQFI